MSEDVMMLAVRGMISIASEIADAVITSVKVEPFVLSSFLYYRASWINIKTTKWQSVSFSASSIANMDVSSLHEQLSATVDYMKSSEGSDKPIK